MIKNTSVNTLNLQKEIKWLQEVIEARLKFGDRNRSDASNTGPSYLLEELPPPEMVFDNSAYARFIKDEDVSNENRLLLILAMTPHIQPQLLDIHLAGKRSQAGRPLSEVGGVVGEQFRGFIPTGLTYLFLVSGYDSAHRLQLIKSLLIDNLLLNKEIISFGRSGKMDPIFSGPIIIDNSVLLRLTETQNTGKLMI